MAMLVRMRRASIWSVAIATVISLFLAGCADEQPVMCDSLDAVQHTVENLRNANVSENGMAAFTAGLDQLRADVDQLLAGAEDEFKNQIDAVQSAVGQLESSVRGVREDPSAATLTIVREAYSDLRSAVEALVGSMRNACA
jgi:outer membrane murein-binding lipoprotein Lpp